MLINARVNAFRFALAALISGAALPLSVFAQVNITGKVTDETGKGLAGVQVSLRKQKLSATTGADGSYTLNGNSSILQRLDGKGPAGLALDNGMLSFRVSRGVVPVDIRAFDLKGNTLATLLSGDLKRGEYRVNPFPAGLRAGAGMVLLRARIGDDAFTLKLIKTPGDGVQATAVEAALSPIALRKAADAVVDTLVATLTGYSTGRKKVSGLTGEFDFMIMKPETFWGDPAGYPAAKNVMTYVFLNRTNGKYPDNQIYWTTGGQTHTIAEQSTYDMPANSSGRVTFHLGTATGQYWDFIEHTITATNWYGNTTRVDAYGLPLAIRLICGDGTDEMLGEQYDVFYMGRDNFFKAYRAAVPQEFYPTVDNSQPYRITAPGKGDGGFGPGQKYANYFDDYLKQIGVTGATTNDAFACAGNPFGSNAQLAGAVNRHVAQLDKTQWTNPENFYLQAPANFYAKFMHDIAFQEKAYGFAYDDAAGFAAYTACSKPKTLIVAVGF